MEKHLDAIADAARRLPADRLAPFCAGCAELLLPLYAAYDPADRFSLLREQLDLAWAHLAAAPTASTPATLAKPQTLADRTVPDVDHDPSPHAAIAQTAALTVTFAVACGTAPSPDLARHACDELDLAAQFLSSDADEDREYSEALIAMRGLPLNELTRRLDELNRRPSKASRAKRQLTKSLKSFAAAVNALATAPPGPAGLATFRENARATALRPPPPRA